MKLCLGAGSPALRGGGAPVGALAPTDAIQIGAIAWRLARIPVRPAAPAARYARLVCLAEHALLMVRILDHSQSACAGAASPQLLLAGLHHHSHALTASPPLNPEPICLDQAPSARARQRQRAIEARFGLIDTVRTHHHLLRQADAVARLTLARDLLPRPEDSRSPQPRELEPFDGVDLRDGPQLSADDWQSAVMATHDALIRQTRWR